MKARKPSQQKNGTLTWAKIEKLAADKDWDTLDKLLGVTPGVLQKTLKESKWLDFGDVLRELKRRYKEPNYIMKFSAALRQ